MKNLLIILLVFITSNVFANDIAKRDLGADCQTKMENIKKFDSELENQNKDYDNSIVMLLKQSAIEDYQKSCSEK